MSRICLDTSAYSYFKRGLASAVEAIRKAGAIEVPVVVVGELRSGFLLGSHAQRNDHELQAFLTDPVVRVVDVDREVADCYADIVATLRREGNRMPTNDLWIAATAVRTGAVVLTYDADFRRISRVGCIVLQP